MTTAEKEKLKMEKIIEKIEKLFALAGNNPNENEAIAAAARAQELMAKYNLEMADLGTSEKKEELGTEMFEGGRGKWRYQLAVIIARNFRCKTWLLGKNVVFLGYKNDAKIALQTFTFIYKTGMTLAGRVYAEHQKLGKSTKKVLNTYYLGFLHGISEILDKQCKALMVITPEEVNKKFEEITQHSKQKNSTLNYDRFDRETFERGKSEGRSCMNSRAIEA